MVEDSMPKQDGALPYQRISIEVVVPVHNEAVALPYSIETLCSYLEAYFPYRWSVVIADNASTDATLDTAGRLAAYHPHVSVLHLREKGRGRALKAAWLASEANVVTYMDVDLSTNLRSFLPLVTPLATGHSDLAIGSRLLKGAVVTRQWKRELISRCYNLLIKLLFRNRFTDAQCGFKALKRSVALALVPMVEDDEWFFDTELLLLAEQQRLRIYEVPVHWIEDLDSRVRIVPTAMKDIRGLLRVWRCRWRDRSWEGRFRVTTALFLLGLGVVLTVLGKRNPWGEKEKLTRGFAPHIGCAEGSVRARKERFHASRGSSGREAVVRRFALILRLVTLLAHVLWRKARVSGDAPTRGVARVCRKLP